MPFSMLSGRQNKDDQGTIISPRLVKIARRVATLSMK